MKITMGRILVLLKNLWTITNSRLAQDLGVSESTISRTINEINIKSSIDAMRVYKPYLDPTEKNSLAYGMDEGKLLDKIKIAAEAAGIGDAIRNLKYLSYESYVFRLLYLANSDEVLDVDSKDEMDCDARPSSETFTIASDEQIIDVFNRAISIFKVAHFMSRDEIGASSDISEFVETMRIKLLPHFIHLQNECIYGQIMEFTEAIHSYNSLQTFYSEEYSSMNDLKIAREEDLSDFQKIFLKSMFNDGRNVLEIYSKVNPGKRLLYNTGSIPVVASSDSE